MGEVHYLISEASKRTQVAISILQYWEQTLGLPSGHTEGKHRFYTEEDIQLFCCIKELLEQGIRMEDLKAVLPDLLHTKEKLVAAEKAKALSNTGSSADTVNTDKVLPDTAGNDPCVSSPDLMEQLSKQLSLHVKELLLSNNEVLQEALCQMITGQVAKDMKLLLQAQERQEEERFQRLDTLIRQQQAYRREVSRPAPVRAFQRLFGEA